ncbi:hypothetical protein CU098_001519 [Rhizopus stolonifer]|uniref:Dolichyl-phosphate-mannose--protein mannosyltransferase n=2 Tax=Mucorineae TaxID=1344963 RepID=A0A367IX27_RHIST|nr:hypothetical protein CU098_001519 [Rhizopus stolonifer]
MNHLEISGNKLAKEPRNNWVATDILGVNATEVNLGKDKTVKHMHFLVKFVELQLRMILHNNRLTGTHPYQSSPIVWPMMLRGISYWTEASSNGQIYLTGNIAGWWIGLTCIGVFSMIYMGHMILQKRDKVMMHEATRIRLTRTGGFFLLLWAMHYFPFFLMGRCLFLHHYLPAMACNYLLLGTVFDYLFVDGINTPISYQPHDKKFSLNQARLKLKSFVAAGILIGMQFMVYLFLSPLTYGTPGLSAEEATRRKVLKTWDIQFGK